MPLPSIPDRSSAEVGSASAQPDCGRSADWLVRVGRVVDAESGDRATVALMPVAACQRCALRGGCGVQLLPVTPVQLVCRNLCQATPGERVIVELAPPVIGWRALVWQSYGHMLSGLLAGLVAGYVIGWHLSDSTPLMVSDGLTAIGGILGMAGSWHWRRHANRSDPEVGQGLATPEGRIVNKITGDSI